MICSDTIVCIECETKKPLSEFYKDKSRKGGHKTKCKICFEKSRRSPYTPIRFEGIKCCAKCNTYKEFFEFSSNKSKEDGFQTYCKSCLKLIGKEYRNRSEIRIMNKQYREDNKEYSAAKQKEYYENNKGNVLANCKRYREENKEKIAERVSKYYQKNKLEITAKNEAYRKKNRKEIAAKSREYYYGNKDEVLRKNKEYRKKNKDEIAVRRKDYRKKNLKQENARKLWYRHNSINYKLGCNLRSRLRTAIKCGYKAGSAVRDLGCSVDFLKNYLESMFYQHKETGDEMSWGNWGVQRVNGPRMWNIDHIVPLSSFDLTDRQQFLEAFHYTNLQPLWAEENEAKGTTVQRVENLEVGCLNV